MKLKKNK